MQHLQVLILVPFYFCAAIAALPVLVLLARILRLKIGINPLVYASIVLAVAGIVVPLGLDLVDLERYRGRGLLALVVTSIVVAFIDSALRKVLPLPLDDELAEL